MADPAAPALRMEWLDELDDACRVIETLSGLLAACGEDVLDSGLAREAGYMIKERIQRLKALREKMGAAR